MAVWVAVQPRPRQEKVMNGRSSATRARPVAYDFPVDLADRDVPVCVSCSGDLALTGADVSRSCHIDEYTWWSRSCCAGLLEFDVPVALAVQGFNFKPIVRRASADDDGRVPRPASGSVAAGLSARQPHPAAGLLAIADVSVADRRGGRAGSCEPIRRPGYRIRRHPGPVSSWRARSQRLCAVSG